MHLRHNLCKLADIEAEKHMFTSMAVKYEKHKFTSMTVKYATVLHSKRVDFYHCMVFAVFCG